MKSIVPSRGSGDEGSRLCRGRRQKSCVPGRVTNIDIVTMRTIIEQAISLAERVSTAATCVR
jgi:hypothetical protein